MSLSKGHKFTKLIPLFAKFVSKLALKYKNRVTNKKVTKVYFFVLLIKKQIVIYIICLMTK
jgi:hypothetical protein